MERATQLHQTVADNHRYPVVDSAAHWAAAPGLATQLLYRLN
ncbi:MAG TPA: hypothetical protein VFZ97_01915 [Acidimicrobiales bacterium]